MRRQTRLEVRATDSEMSAWAEAAAGERISRSEWVRRACQAATTGAGPLSTADRQAIAETAEQLRRIGVNLNQLVRALQSWELNPRRELPDREDWLAIHQLLSAALADLRGRLS